MKRTTRALAYAVLSLLVTAALTVLSTAPANAAWKTLGQDGGNVKYLICKTAVNSGYGPLWKITLVMATTRDYSGSAKFQGLRYGRVTGTHNLSARNGAWDVQTAFLSRVHNDKFRTSFGAGQISTGQGLGYTMSDPISVSTVPYC